MWLGYVCWYVDMLICWYADMWPRSQTPVAPSHHYLFHIYNMFTCRWCMRIAALRTVPFLSKALMYFWTALRLFLSFEDGLEATFSRILCMTSPHPTQNQCQCQCQCKQIANRFQTNLNSVDVSSWSSNDLSHYQHKRKHSLLAASYPIYIPPSPWLWQLPFIFSLGPNPNPTGNPTPVCWP